MILVLWVGFVELVIRIFPTSSVLVCLVRRKRVLPRPLRPPVFVSSYRRLVPVALRFGVRYRSLCVHALVLHVL